MTRLRTICKITDNYIGFHNQFSSLKTIWFSWVRKSKQKLKKYAIISKVVNSNNEKENIINDFLQTNRALYTINRMDSIIILPGVKGGMTVIQDDRPEGTITERYHQLPFFSTRTQSQICRKSIKPRGNVKNYQRVAGKRGVRLQMRISYKNGHGFTSKAFHSSWSFPLLEFQHGDLEEHYQGFRVISKH